MQRACGNAEVMGAQARRDVGEQRWMVVEWQQRLEKRLTMEGLGRLRRLSAKVKGVMLGCVVARGVKQVESGGRSNAR